MKDRLFDFEKVLNYQPNKSLILTLYLVVDGAKTSKKEYLTKLNSMISETKEIIDSETSYKKTAKKELTDLLDKIKSYINDEYKYENEKTLLIFAGTKKEMWEIYRLPVSFKSKVIIDPKPHTQNLRALVKNYKKYAVLLLDREKAQIYQIYMGRITEYLAALISDVPPKVNFRFESGLRENKILHRIEEKLNQFFKFINENIFNLLKDKKFDYLILAGKKDVTNIFKNYLHNYINSLVIGSFEIESTAADDAVLLKATKIIENFELENKRKVIDKILEELEPQGAGVFGLQNVIGALSQDNIKILAYLDNLSIKGYVCPGCGIILTESEGKCPNCLSMPVFYNDIVDEIVEKALIQGSEILPIEELKDEQSYNLLSSKEGIGAVLRYKKK